MDEKNINSGRFQRGYNGWRGKKNPGLSLRNKGNKYGIGHIVTNEMKAKINKSGLELGRGWNKGMHLPQELKDKLSKSHIGLMTGSKHWNWKGGISSEYAKIKSSHQYKEWRRTVLVRDNYTCQMCGVRGGKLQTDHIKPFAYFPELRFDTSNGRALCAPCHESTDTYKARAKKFALQIT